MSGQIGNISFRLHMHGSTRTIHSVTARNTEGQTAVTLVDYDDAEDARAHAAVLRFALAWKPGTNRMLRTGRIAAMMAEAQGREVERDSDEWHRILDAAWSVRCSLKSKNVPAAASLVARVTDLSVEQAVALCEMILAMAGEGP